MSERLVIGMDPSFRGFGIADGDRTTAFGTKAGEPTDARIDQLLDAIDEFIFDRPESETRRQLWVVEAPMLASKPADAKGGVPGSHLYEVGALMRALRSEYARQVRDLGVELEYIEPAIAAIRHHSIGVNAPKDDLAWMVEAIHGVKFDNVRGVPNSRFDRLVAWQAQRYGVDYDRGQLAHQVAAARGAGGRERSMKRHAARTVAANRQLALSAT